MKLQLFPHQNKKVDNPSYLYIMIEKMKNGRENNYEYFRPSSVVTGSNYFELPPSVFALVFVETSYLDCQEEMV